ncbi:MAG: response regulator transcription factor [Kofleriaceae bacterium]
MRVLIDVANGRVSEELVELLVRNGHVVERGSAAVSAARFDVVVVGTVELAERLHRERPAQAVIVYTKPGDVEARIRALKAGASDAVDASFPMSQVAVRFDAAGRRAAMIPRDPETIVADGCTIDLSAATAERDGVLVDLTKKEVDVIRWLSRHAGRVVERGELLPLVWLVSPASESRAVDVAIAGLRAKIARDAANPAIIVSIKGVGYRWS